MYIEKLMKLKSKDKSVKVKNKENARIASLKDHSSMIQSLF